MTFVRPKVWGHRVLPWSFDGSTYVNLGSDLTGLSDLKQGLLSLWFRASVTGTLKRILYTPGAGFACNINASDNLVIRGENAAGTAILVLTSSITVTDGKWHHAAVEWGLGSGIGEMYIDRVDRLAASPTLTDDTIDYTRGDWTLGATEAGADPYVGELAQVYFDDTRRDITTASILDDYITSDGDPVDFGEDGSGPSGGSPILYMLTNALDVRDNSGTGGDFETETGEAVEGTVIPVTAKEVPDSADFNPQFGTTPLDLYEALTSFDFLRLMFTGSATTVNNTTTLANVTDMSFSVKASETWVFVAFLRGTTTVAADWRFNVSTPSGSAGRQSVLGTQAEAPSQSLGTDVQLSTNTSNETPLIFYATVRVGSSSGTVQLQMAQGTADANDTTIDNGVFGVAMRIAA